MRYRLELIAGRFCGAGQAINTMISRGARAVSVVVPGAGRVSKPSKVVAEGMIFLDSENVK